jgi:hypothetical protein
MTKKLTQTFLYPLLISTICLITSSASAHAQSPAVAKSPSTFIKTWQQGTAVKLLLPSPSAINQTKKTFHYQSNDLQSLSQQAYRINFDWTADCGGAPVCSQGNMVAININASMAKHPRLYLRLPIPWINKTHHKKNDPINSMVTRVQLTPQLKGYWIKAYTPALNNTPWNTLAWVKNNTYYQLSIKNISQNASIRIAQQMITEES